MRRFLKRLLILAVVLALIALSALYFLKGPLTKYVAQRGVAAALQQGVKITYDELIPSMTGATIQRLNFFFQRVLIQLQLEQVRAHVSPLSLFGMKPRLNWGGIAYGGSFDGQTQVDTAGSANSSGALQSLQLASHPQLNGSGISRGILNLTLDEVTTSITDWEAIRGTAAIRDLELRKTFLPGLLLPVPALNQGALVLTFDASPREVKVDPFRFTSSLGEVQGTLRVNRDVRTFRQTLEGDFSIRLSPEGELEYGQLLAMAAGGNSSSAYSVRITGASCPRAGEDTMVIRAFGICLQPRFIAI